MTYCISLHNELKLENTGAKAYNLSRMMRAGFSVPRGFVITTSAFKKWCEIQIFPEDIEQEITTLLKEIDAEKYMVRSSAVGEDSAGSSFAGQLSSFISDANIEVLKENIIKCWQSYFGENVGVYEQTSGVKLAGMGVVIQELIEPEYAGVLFTRSFAESDLMLCEYVAGHGEKLVSGEENPGRFHCKKSDGIPDETPPFAFKELYEISLKLEQFFKTPLDIEWVFKNGKTHIVQARPITALKEKKRVFWSNTNVNENYPGPITPLLYSIARESYYHYFKNLSRLLQVPEKSIRQLEPDYANIIGIFGCRMYYNMSSIQNIIAASPFANLLSKSFSNFVGYQESDESLREKRSFKNAANFVKSFAKLNRQLEKNVREFENAADDFHANSLKAKELHELRECFHQFIEIRMHSWYRASLADFFAMVFHGVLGLVCKRLFGDEAQSVHNKLISAIPDLISSKPVTETWKIAEVIRRNPHTFELLKSKSSTEFLKEISADEKHFTTKNSIEGYLQNWGFRCSGELMFTEKNYCEEPEKFIELLQSYVSQNHDNPEAIINAKNEERKVLLRSLKRKILKKKAIVFPLALAKISLLQAVIKLCFKAISARERVRLKQALLYYRFKTVVLKIGEVFKANNLIAEADDIFFLKYGEIAENLTASDMLPQQLAQIIQSRKEQFLKNSAQIFPDDFSSYLGEYPQPNEVAFKKNNSNGDAKITGLSACGGFIKGKVRVLESVMELHKIQRGDILVTRQTDPGWASIFPLISGLIVERGGMLSHGAIVAREFGIPAVVGVHNATAIFNDGDEIELFADRGEIFKTADEIAV